MKGDLVRGDGGVAEARRHGARQHEREHERGRADEDPLPEGEHAARKSELHGRLAGLEGAEHDDHERRTHPELSECSPPSRAGDPPVESVDEQHLEDDVRDVPRDEDHERRAQVGDPAKVALRPEREEGRGEADRGDTQILDRVVGGLPLSPHQCHELRRQQRDERRNREAEHEREPHGLRPEPPGCLPLAGPARARHLRGRPVLEEVEDRERAAEDRERDPERGELRAAEVAHDRRVDEEVDGLGRERAQRGQREPDDLAVVPGADPHPVASIVASYAAT